MSEDMKHYIVERRWSSRMRIPYKVPHCSEIHIWSLKNPLLYTLRQACQGIVKYECSFLRKGYYVTDVLYTSLLQVLLLFPTLRNINALLKQHLKCGGHKTRLYSENLRQYCSIVWTLSQWNWRIPTTTTQRKGSSDTHDFTKTLAPSL